MARSDHQLGRFLAACFVCGVLSWSMGCVADGAFPFSAFPLPQSVVILSDPEDGPRFTVLAADGSSIAVAIDEQALRDFKCAGCASCRSRGIASAHSRVAHFRCVTSGSGPG